MRENRAESVNMLSRIEAKRAIYIDFEGFMKESPALLGVLVDNSFEQIVFDTELRDAARATALRISALSVEGARILDQGLSERRYIVAYSLLEQLQLARWANLDISGQYKNARAVAQRWRSRFHPDAAANGNGLKDYFKLIGVERGRHLGDRKSTKWIRAVRNGLRTNRTFDGLTSTQKAFWTKLLQHNRIDCEGMRTLIVRVSDELETGHPAPLGSNQYETTMRLVSSPRTG
jgi:hypothetical protein